MCRARPHKPAFIFWMVFKDALRLLVIQKPCSSETCPTQAEADLHQEEPEHKAQDPAPSHAVPADRNGREAQEEAAVRPPASDRIWRSQRRNAASRHDAGSGRLLSLPRCRNAICYRVDWQAELLTLPMTYLTGGRGMNAFGDVGGWGFRRPG